MTPFEIGKLALGGLGVVGDLLSGSNSNATNLQIARENNQFQEAMFNKQMAYNWDMWSANNQYNDPSSQVRRYIDAGINPQLALEGSSPAEASGGSVSPPAGTPAHVDPIRVSDSLNEVGDVLYNSEARKLMLDRMESDNELARLNAVDREDEVFHLKTLRSFQRREAEHRAGITEEQDRFQRESHDYRIGLSAEELTNKQAGTRFINEQIASMAVERALSSYHLETAPARFKAELSEINARISELASQSHFNYEQARLAYQQNLKTFAETYGIQINNRLSDALFNSAVKAGDAQNWSIYRRSRLDAQADMDTFNFLYGNEDSRTTIGRLFSLSRSGVGSTVSPLKVGKIQLGQP